MTMSERKNSPATERNSQFVRTSLAAFATIGETTRLELLRWKEHDESRTCQTETSAILG